MGNALREHLGGPVDGLAEFPEISDLVQAFRSDLARADALPHTALHHFVRELGKHSDVLQQRLARRSPTAIAQLILAIIDSIMPPLKQAGISEFRLTQTHHDLEILLERWCQPRQNVSKFDRERLGQLVNEARSLGERFGRLISLGSDVSSDERSASEEELRNFIQRLYGSPFSRRYPGIVILALIVLFEAELLIRGDTFARHLWECEYDLAVNRPATLQEARRSAVKAYVSQHSDLISEHPRIGQLIYSSLVGGRSAGERLRDDAPRTAEQLAHALNEVKDSPADTLSELERILAGKTRDALALIRTAYEQAHHGKRILGTIEPVFRGQELDWDHAISLVMGLTAKAREQMGEISERLPLMLSGDQRDRFQYAILSREPYVVEALHLYAALSSEQRVVEVEFALRGHGELARQAILGVYQRMIGAPFVDQLKDHLNLELELHRIELELVQFYLEHGVHSFTESLEIAELRDRIRKRYFLEQCEDVGHRLGKLIADPDGDPTKLAEIEAVFTHTCRHLHFADKESSLRTAHEKILRAGIFSYIETRVTTLVECERHAIIAEDLGISRGDHSQSLRDRWLEVSRRDLFEAYFGSCGSLWSEIVEQDKRALDIAAHQGHIYSRLVVEASFALEFGLLSGGSEWNSQTAEANLLRTLRSVPLEYRELISEFFERRFGKNLRSVLQTSLSPGRGAALRKLLVALLDGDLLTERVAELNLFAHRSDLLGFVEAFRNIPTVDRDFTILALNRIASQNDDSGTAAFLGQLGRYFPRESDQSLVRAHFEGDACRIFVAELEHAVRQGVVQISKVLGRVTNTRGDIDVERLQGYLDVFRRDHSALYGESTWEMIARDICRSHDVGGAAAQWLIALSKGQREEALLAQFVYGCGQRKADVVREVFALEPKYQLFALRQEGSIYGGHDATTARESAFGRRVQGEELALLRAMNQHSEKVSRLERALQKLENLKGRGIESIVEQTFGRERATTLNAYVRRGVLRRSEILHESVRVGSLLGVQVAVQGMDSSKIHALMIEHDAQFPSAPLHTMLNRIFEGADRQEIGRILRYGSVDARSLSEKVEAALELSRRAQRGLLSLRMSAQVRSHAAELRAHQAALSANGVISEPGRRLVERQIENVESEAIRSRRLIERTANRLAYLSACMIGAIVALVLGVDEVMTLSGGVFTLGIAFTCGIVARRLCGGDTLPPLQHTGPTSEDRSLIDPRLFLLPLYSAEGLVTRALQYAGAQFVEKLSHDLLGEVSRGERSEARIPRLLAPQQGPVISFEARNLYAERYSVPSSAKCSLEQRLCPAQELNKRSQEEGDHPFHKALHLEFERIRDIESEGFDNWDQLSDSSESHRVLTGRGVGEVLKVTNEHHSPSDESSNDPHQEHGEESTRQHLRAREIHDLLLNADELREDAVAHLHQEKKAIQDYFWLDRESAALRVKGRELRAEAAELEELVRKSGRLEDGSLVRLDEVAADLFELRREIQSVVARVEEIQSEMPRAQHVLIQLEEKWSARAQGMLIWREPHQAEAHERNDPLESVGTHSADSESSSITAPVEPPTDEVEGAGESSARRVELLRDQYGKIQSVRVTPAS